MLWLQCLTPLPTIFQLYRHNVSFFDFKILFVMENLRCNCKIQFDYENIKHGKSLLYDLVAKLDHVHSFIEKMIIKEYSVIL